MCRRYLWGVSPQMLIMLYSVRIVVISVELSLLRCLYWQCQHILCDVDGNEIVTECPHHQWSLFLGRDMILVVLILEKIHHSRLTMNQWYSPLQFFAWSSRNFCQASRFSFSSSEAVVVFVIPQNARRWILSSWSCNRQHASKITAIIILTLK